jgi:hypothetical protein
MRYFLDLVAFFDVFLCCSSAFFFFFLLSSSQVMFLLDGGVDPNCITLQGQTPLHYAIASGHDEVVRVLLERGTSSFF